MKHFFVLVFGLINILFIQGQDTVKGFSSYQFTIPGAKIECKMVPIKMGEFLMGSSNKDKYKKANEGPLRSVTIAAFWMGAYEVTRDQFNVFYNDETVTENASVDAVTRPSPQYIDFSLGMGKEGGYPVNSLSQYSAIMYCKWLYNKTGIFYRLPTEAEWEYACRAGSTTTFYFGDDEKQLDKYAWYKDNSENKFQKTGLKLPNAWGLYDMLGNVNEWTLDHYEENRLEKMPDRSVNPVVMPNNARYPKALRGGGYADEAVSLRIANRFKSDPSWNRRDPQIPKSKWWLTDAPAVGFRIIRPLIQPTKEAINDFYNSYVGN